MHMSIFKFYCTELLGSILDRSSFLVLHSYVYKKKNNELEQSAHELSIQYTVGARNNNDKKLLGYQLLLVTDVNSDQQLRRHTCL